MRPVWLAIAVVLFLLALMAFLGGAFSQIISCEYCGEEKRDTLIRWWGSAGVFTLGAVGALYLRRSAGSED